MSCIFLKNILWYNFIVTTKQYSFQAAGDSRSVAIFLFKGEFCQLPMTKDVGLQ